MAVPFLNNIDLVKNQLLNAVFQNLAVAPATPVEGQFYYNTTDKKMFYYNGTAWVDTTYLLPIASATVIGGVKVGSGLAIAADGTLSATGTNVDIINNLTSDRTDAALAAAQGKVLKGLIDTLQTAINGLGTAATKNVGTASGNIPVLDSNGKLNTSVLPALAITEVFTVASQSAMTSLTAQQGDVAVRTDVNKTFILSKEPAATAANWIELQFPISVTSVNGKTGIITLTGEDINATVGSVTKSVQSFLADLGEIDLKVQENTATITTIETQVNNITNTKGEAEGKNIHIEDSAEEPFVDVELYGESTQNGTPTSDNLVEIENIEGNIEFKVEGKNLFNNNFNDYTMPKDYRIYPIKLEKGKVYRFNTTLIGTAVTGIVVGIVKNGTMYSEFSSILFQTINAYGGINNLSFLVDDTWISPKLVVYATTQTKFEEIFKNYNVQLIKGTEILDYEPYKSQVAYFPLAEGQKLMEGSYLADDGIHHSRGQVVFDGSDDENWQIEGTNNFYSNIVIQNSKSSSLVLCNYQKSINKGLGESENCFISNSKKFNFQSDTINHTVADFKNWLSTHNLIVEYELAEEEVVPYTAEQQTAWNKIKALMTYKNITNITSDAYAKIIYMRDNGLDVYETKQNAEKNYTKTTQKFAEQKITTDEISSKVSSLETTLENNYSTTVEMNSAITAKVNEIITELLPIKIITGVIPGSSYDADSKTQTVVIDYPSGFNASNTIVIASMLKPVSTDCTSTYSGRVDVLLYSSGEYANKMEVLFSEAWGLDMYYKIVLMKM